MSAPDSPRTTRAIPFVALLCLAVCLSLGLSLGVDSALALDAAQPEHGAEAEDHGAEDPGAEDPAADHGDGHGEGQGSLFSGNLGNALWTVLIFAALLWFLGRYAWGPILQGLQGREQFIRDSLEQAKQQRDEAEARLQEYEAKLAQARGEVEEILDEARRDAGVLRQREEERAREEAEQIIARARREIGIATETAVKDLYARASKLSVEIAEKILQRELKPEDHARLIDDAVRSFETRKPN